MDIEAIAVAAVSDVIASCPHLRPYIDLNDKTPFTDGYIDIFDGDSKSKRSWAGRITVQVKGRTNRSKLARELAFKVERDALRAYRSDSGILYFVVRIHPQERIRRIFYTLLSPFKIDQLLHDRPGEDDISVNFRLLPTTCKDLERLVWIAWLSRNQRIATGFDPELFRHMQSMTIHSAVDLDFEHPLTLKHASSDFVIEMTTGGGMSIPLPAELSLIPSDYLPREVQVDIASGGISFDKITVQKESDDVVRVDITDGFSLAIVRGDDSTVSLTLQPNFADRLKALRFLFALVDTNELSVNGITSKFGSAHSADVSDFRQHLNILEQMNQVFEFLRVDTSRIDASSITDEEVGQLHSLYRGLILNEELQFETDGPSRLRQTVGDQRLELVVLPDGFPNRWTILDPLSPDSIHQYRWEASDEGVRSARSGADAIPVTAYDMLGEGTISQVLNLRLDEIVPAYKALSEFETSAGYANLFLLRLIEAADRDDARREDILSVSADLNEWIISIDGEQPRHRLNRWQIMARRGQLTDSDRKDIRSLRRSLFTDTSAERSEFALACALLLGDLDEADDLLTAMEPDQADKIRSWPIFALRNFP